ncbi:hypothetical protein [Streptomyces sp. NPDC088350]|uniref:hypothetical protein n=1 Tax=Streptomyces sp. NPDC088350 TaxID=3365854 RepID=UPI00380270AB
MAGIGQKVLADLAVNDDGAYGEIDAVGERAGAGDGADLVGAQGLPYGVQDVVRQVGVVVGDALLAQETRGCSGPTVSAR